MNLRICSFFENIKRNQHDYSFFSGIWYTQLTENVPADDREQTLKTTLRELFIYLVFVILLCIGKLYPVNIYLFKSNNENTKKRCEICSKLTIITSEQRHLFLVFLLLTLNK